MRDCGDLLRREAERIAADASEAVDLDGAAGILADLVKELADVLDSGLESIDAERLREACEDEESASRLLRVTQADCIETLRSEFSGQRFTDAVLALREGIRKALPRAELSPWCAQLRHALTGETIACVEQVRVLRFFDVVAATMRDMVYAHDINGNMFYVNDAGLALIKETREDMFVGLTVYDFVVQEYADLVEARLESPGAVLRAPYSIEIYAKDGERVPIEIDTRPLRDDDGNVVGVVGIARDLRLERRLQDEIQRSNNQLSQIIANAPLGILLADKDGRVRDANETAAQLCGIGGIHALIGMPLPTIVERDEDRVAKAVQRVVEDGAELRQRVRLHTRYGSDLNCDVLLSPLKGSGGEVTGLFVLLSDVSDEVALRESLVQSEKLSALGKVTAGVAHEFNNPLTGIFGYAQYLLSAVEDPSHKRRLEQIMEEAQRCRRLVQNLLSFAHRTGSDKKPRNVNELLKEALSLYEYQMQMDGIRVNTSLDADLPDVPVSEQDVQRVFLNIIANAHQALKSVAEQRDLTLDVKTARKGNRVEIVFRDNGPGIPREDIQRVFDPFFTTKKQGEGMGLGLSVAYGTVQDHDGDIRVESAEGEGAALIINLPITSLRDA